MPAILYVYLTLESVHYQGEKEKKKGENFVGYVNKYKKGFGI